MKSVQFTVAITGLVPDDIDINKLFLNLRLQDVQVRVIQSKPGEFTGYSTVPSDLQEYETVNVESID